MRQVLSAQQMLKADNDTINETGIPSMVLMERAALAVVKQLKDCKLQEKRILVICGGGNNGGDGIAAARLLRPLAKKVTILVLDEKTEAMKAQRNIAENLKMDICDKWKDQEYDIIIDAIFGIGLHREVTGAFAEVIDRINKTEDAYVCSIDIPSGIHSDTGEIMGTAVKADLTVTFSSYKRGQLLYPGKEYCGKLVLADIGVVLPAFPDSYLMLERKDLMELLPTRKKDGHKGTFGKVLLVAGKENMCGAALLCGEAILRTGAGMLMIISDPSNREILQARLPEAMLTQNLEEAVKWCDVIVAGPGIGTEEKSEETVAQLLNDTQKPMILDADALKLIGANPALQEQLTHCNAVLTPHPGELKALLQINDATDTKQRFMLIQQAFQKYNNIIIAKDAVTVIQTKTEDKSCDRIYINASGNDGMATAGSGDVLAGILGGLVAQRIPIWQAAPLGVLIHGLAGDVAAMIKGHHGMTASDIILCLTNILEHNEAEQ